MSAAPDDGALARCVRRRSKKASPEVRDRLRQKYDFAKTQETQGWDYRQGLRTLEEN